MRQALHIFKKDVRRLKYPIALVLAATALFAYADALPWAKLPPNSLMPYAFNPKPLIVPDDAGGGFHDSAIVVSAGEGGLGASSSEVSILPGLLILVWCAGSMVMRLTDLLVAVGLNFPFSRYDSMALAAFDLLTAVVAIWLRANLPNVSLPVRLLWSVCGLLVTLTVARIVMGIELAPRFLAPKRPAGINSAVYGNNLAQQITSTFDVVLSILALAILTAAILAGRHRRHTAKPTPQALPPGHTPARPPQSPRIHRPTQHTTQHPPADQPKIYRTP